MKINKIYALIALCAALMIPLSCKKNFLDQTDSQQTTASAFFNKASDGVALINAIYDTYQNADLLKKSIWYYANFQTHDFFNWGNDRFYNTYAIPSDFSAIETFWTRAYVGIARANSALPIIADMKTRGVLTADLANRLTGETYFLRGMTYYYLGASFGGVPLELTTGANLGLKPRSTQDEVFNQVISDLKTAASLLPWKEDLPTTEIGRATKGAAYGFLGAAQMWVKDYTGALASFNQLNGKYTLLPNFIDVNEYDHQNSPESLFEVQFDVAGTQSWGAGNEVAWISDFSWPEEISNFGYDYANDGLYNSFQNGDKRKLATVIGPGDPNISPGIIGRGGIAGYPLVKAGFAAGDARYIGDDGKIINTCGTKTKPWRGSDNTQLRTGYYCEKMWRDPTLDANSGNSTIFGAQNQILLRYAEVLLSKAECQIRNGDVPGGLATLKIVRDRAWGGAAPAIMQDGDKTTPITDPLQMVYSEYRHELTGEYSTFYDLRRAGVAIDFVRATYGVTIPAGRDLYPIPQIERGLNPNLTQNPAYGN
ncbi:RagB/SusD family nutrient uptake outer membrane protein [Mucilaginibacter sp. BJC16-A38]|uniref:RagB/SusD family nutrient uptake outer membrane protein n=1 Tax=Mucilaginibacter phenanthrenivorans TaxID=1234842 RepID=UPI0021570DE1|nr:RagB/SusD family nutrient uptake outer membrane protein [Mucilaginibacter phenanthrenivorans]MCR8559541.1 RagB/SusD family nutrient uptake outer membrane protein [Mucilaginibacter phenanthrenivorans]